MQSHVSKLYSCCSSIRFCQSYSQPCDPDMQNVSHREQDVRTQRYASKAGTAVLMLMSRSCYLSFVIIAILFPVQLFMQSLKFL